MSRHTATDDAARSGLARAIHAECHKLLVLRSTWLVLGVPTVLGVLVGLMALHSTAASWTTLAPADRAAFDSTADAFTGFQFAQLALGSWGVLAATSEYAQGTISSTLSAVPRRGTVFTAKLTVVTFVSFLLSLVATGAAWTLGQLVLRRHGLDASISDPGVLRALLSAGVVLTTVTVLGFGLGSLLRHTAAALAALVALLFLSWPAARAIEGLSYLPDRWLLVNAADALVATHPITGPNALRTPSEGGAIVVVVVYLLMILGLGAVRNRQDP